MSKPGGVRSYQALILPMALGLFGTFPLRQFFLTMPIELGAAAMIDDASRPRIVPGSFCSASSSAASLSSPASAASEGGAKD